METTTPAIIQAALSKVRYQVPRYSGWKRLQLERLGACSNQSDTKYRVIADGNQSLSPIELFQCLVRYQVPRYSGWKPLGLRFVPVYNILVRYQVPRYSGWKLA